MSVAAEIQGFLFAFFGIGAESETHGVNKGKLLYPNPHFHVLSVWSVGMKGMCPSLFIPSHFVPEGWQRAPFHLQDYGNGPTSLG